MPLLVPLVPPEFYSHAATSHRVHSSPYFGSSQADNSGLLHRIAREREVREVAQVEKARLETELEQDSERAFNSASTRNSSLTSSPCLVSSVPPVSPRSLIHLPLLSPSCVSPPPMVSPRPDRALSPKALLQGI